MKRIKFLSLIFTFLFSFVFSNVKAQETTQTDNQKQAARPFRIMQELDLSREQIQQIRRINQEHKPIMQTAQQNWRQANRNLDAAIYADNAAETEIKELVKAAQVAQAELLKERTLTEFRIRSVLTPEQLIKFRQLREQTRQTSENVNAQNDQSGKTLNRRQQRRIRNRQP